MKLALIGTGIAGLTAAWRLFRYHDLTVFEANDYIGGHTHTVDVETASGRHAIDTGFIVFNDWTYPNFIRLLNELGVASQPTEMSFSVRCERTGLEYNGNNLNTLFAQRRNLLRPAFYRLLLDILRFNRQAAQLLENDDYTMTLQTYLTRHRYSSLFISHYIIPMGAAIWSAQPSQFGAMPVRHFVQFFHNHGLLNVLHRPRWRAICGGSRRYVEALTAPFRNAIRLSCPVAWVRRFPTHVVVKPEGHEPERFDGVIIATHSDQALALLADPSETERTLLGAIAYQRNDVVLHTDTRLLPRRPLAWASWNYHLPKQPQDRVAVTYNMNLLQNLNTPETFCVTLNYDSHIDPEKVLYRTVYHHPVLDGSAVAAQRRWQDLHGVNRTWYCGAYWGYGFHEDGVMSALRLILPATVSDRNVAVV